MGLLVIALSGLLAAAIVPLLHRLAGRTVGWLVSALALGLAIALGGYARVIFSGNAVAESYDWDAGAGLSLAFRLDGLSLVFGILIAGFGSIVLAYSIAYMSGKPGTARFMALLTLFMGSMLGLALADNLVLLYVFWEMTTVSSYLLIGFEHGRAESRRAATQALVVTFGGGLALLAGILLLSSITGTFSISTLLALGPVVKQHALYPAVLVLIAIGAFAKSAHFPFHFWLPDAMEAPTPVSAYLHSVAMVKAGVYLLARLAPVLGDTPAWFYGLTLVGGVTMLFGAWGGLGKTDLKQVLAYATIAVLGLLTLLLGIGTPEAVHAMVLYLVAHALYKGALFLVAGAVDHETGERDITRLGGLWRRMPATAAAAALAAASFAGLPLFLGFVGKERAYEAAMHGPHAGIVSAAIIFATALLVALAAKLTFRPFVARPPAPLEAHEAAAPMWLGALLPALAGAVCGVAPGLLEAPVRVATEAILHSPNPELPPLKALPGLTPVFLTSLAAIAGGAMVYLLVRRRHERPQRAAASARVFDVMLRALERVAHWQTDLLVSGYLRYYLTTVLGTALALILWGILRTGGLPLPLPNEPVRIYEAVILAVVCVAALAAVRAQSRMASAAALGMTGYGVALIFGIFGAPDLAMTQLTVETFTVVILVLVVYRLPQFARLTPPKQRARDVAMAVFTGGVMAAAVLAASGAELAPAISPYFLETAVPLAHGRNVVNVILTDYRALDTMGEIAVLAIAAAGIYSLLRLRARKGKEEEE
jgi:multicomponent Na+:H+ antiporter subunit A